MRATERKLPRGYLPTLDGWRAIAIAAVVLINHDQVHHIGRLSLGFLKWDGHFGVDLFFAISGILICTRLLEQEQMEGTIDLKRFYVRRLFRIQPAAWVYLGFISLLMALHVLQSSQMDVVYAALMVRNYFPLRDSYHAWYTAHFWSLAVEEHFYLLLPGFLVLFRRHRILLLFCVLLLFECWRLAIPHYPQLQTGRNFAFRTDVAVWGILLAAWFALLLTRPAVRDVFQHWFRPWVALLLVVGIRMWFRHYKGEIADLALRSSFSLLVMSTMLHPSALTGRFLEWAPMRLLGRISYSVYLWQMLFFTFYGPVPPPHWRPLAYIQTSDWRYLAVLVAALLSYTLVERPMIRIGHRLTRLPVRRLGELKAQVSIEDGIDDAVRDRSGSNESYDREVSLRSGNS